MRSSFLIISVVLLSFATSIKAQRTDILLNNNWNFRFSHQVEFGKERRVDIPHTWNAQDALIGKIDYKRGIGNYEKKVLIEPAWQGKRLFLRFEGVANIANVFINRKHIQEHRGGYGAFIVELTDLVDYGKENSIMVRVNNAEQLDIMPLLGDFNMYGGIYRDVHLILTDAVCISPLDYASPGVYLVQESVSKEHAKISAKINLSNNAPKTVQRELRLEVKDGDKVVHKDSKNVSLNSGANTQEQIAFEMIKPRLWNGVKDPFMYTVEVSLYENNQLKDQVIQPLGLRYYHTDPDKGFFLNGEHLKLKGVCRHQDRAEVGNALHSCHHQEDVALMVEMGTNAARLAHYPQATEMYDLMDKYGIVTWAEIPFIGPGGYEDKGFVDQPSFRDNGKEQLKELIRQNYNHPAICFWGLFNELKEVGDNPVEYIKELNELAHQEDPTRPTTSASNQDGELNFVTDNIAWNRYDGWYGATPETLGKWLDETHASYPELRIGISEYGAGASIYHQQDYLVQTVPTAWWHPENWQTFYHMENWRIINDRPFVWGSFIWNMFDFGAAHRTEGDRPGVNDKGLVTFDRKVKKDAFYFYKANWNTEEPMLHIAEKRVTNRYKAEQMIMVFTNQAEAELFIDGRSCGKQKADRFSTIKWEGIKLNKGNNHIQVKSTGKVKLVDEVELVYVE